MGARSPRLEQRPNSKASQLRLDPFTIFLDENHQDNPHILRVLNDELPKPHGHIRHKEVPFKTGELDEVWLPTVGKNGWILVTTDIRLWRRMLLRDALFKAGVRAFIFSENSIRGEARAESLRKALPEMRALVRENPPPFIGTITVDGHAHIQYDLVKHRAVMRREKASLQRKQRRSKKKRG
jgi:hypothetical protein